MDLAYAIFFRSTAIFEIMSGRGLLFQSQFSSFVVVSNSLRKNWLSPKGASAAKLPSIEPHCDEREKWVLELHLWKYVLSSSDFLGLLCLRIEVIACNHNPHSEYTPPFSHTKNTIIQYADLTLGGGMLLPVDMVGTLPSNPPPIFFGWGGYLKSGGGFSIIWSIQGRYEADLVGGG